MDGLHMDMRTVVTMRELQYIHTHTCVCMYVHIVRTDKATASHVCMLRTRPPARPHARTHGKRHTYIVYRFLHPSPYSTYVHINSMPPKSEGGAPRLGTYIHAYIPRHPAFALRNGGLEACCG